MVAHQNFQQLYQQVEEMVQHIKLILEDQVEVMVDLQVD
jgi:hypothetical protein